MTLTPGQQAADGQTDMISQSSVQKQTWMKTNESSCTQRSK